MPAVDQAPPPAPPPRILPVTPAERFLATVLRTFQAWNTNGVDEDEGPAYRAMLDLGEWLQEQGMLNSDDRSGFGAAGRDLLARVEAEERTAPPRGQGARQVKQPIFSPIAMTDEPPSGLPCVSEHCRRLQPRLSARIVHSALVLRVNDKIETRADLRGLVKLLLMFEPDLPKPAPKKRTPPAKEPR